ncbi:nucleoside hydrolase [Ferroplasma acidarmanus]|uniref:Inosine-uridine preferring nucleoside hydrolase n=3 Tax=Ferroplasma TaxID=74968 RepID=S0ASD6_FERAC|nr:nucleoside hydrolase [Ferroplasma acidarmanus]AGO61702.1 inosine-uridine preferring nucleoside hydrolase [Ferroplasma acidarmanus Fer1]
MNRVILNVDTGIDDAFAMILLKQYNITPEFIVASSGNSLLENTYRNTAGVAKLLDFDCPVYHGSARPLIKPHYYENFHGDKGLGTYEFNDPVQEKDHHNGIIKMYEALKREKHTIICTSPLTSLGILMRLDNSIKENIEQIIIMGGAFGITPYGKGNMGNAEFNIFYDPEAAKIVMEEDINETIVPLDVTMNRELAIKSIPPSSSGSPLEDFIHKTTKFMIEEHGTFEMHDPIAVFSFIEPDAFKFVNGEITVKPDGSTEFIEKRDGKKRIATGINPQAYRKGLVNRIYGNLA